jgi:ABC-type multidrug transport system fused ATPase/permease subunit
MAKSLPPSKANVHNCNKASRFIMLWLYQIGVFKVILTFSLYIIGYGLVLIQPIILGRIVDFIPLHSNQVLFFSLIMPLSWLVGAGLIGCSKLLTATLTQDIRMRVKEIVFNHVIRLPKSFFSKFQSGAIVHKINEASFNSRYIFQESIVFIIQILLVTVAMLIAFQRLSSQILYFHSILDSLLFPYGILVS